MFDILGLLLVVIFAPIIIINGMNYYKNSTAKSLAILSYVLLGVELFRFFYTAKFYERAYMPSDKVTFTFVTFSVVISLFASFNKSRLGKICKSVLALTALAPVIIALFYPHVYTNELDTYAVVKALYFLESGIVLTEGILLVKAEMREINRTSLLWSLAVTLVYIFSNVMRNVFWIPNMAFDLTWFLCMGAVILSVVLTYAVTVFLLRKKSVNE